MWNLRLLFFVLLLIGARADARVAQQQMEACIPDSVLFEGNQRWWYPGEPLKWMREGIIDSVLDTHPDGFNLKAESPRTPNYTKTIKYLRFTPDHEVLFVSGDCRYISYSPRTRENHSNSIVVGHTYYAHPYWYEGALHFQNGWSNWHVHNQRLRHSRITGEIQDIQVPKGPVDIGYAAVHSCDSGLFTIRVNNSEVRQLGGQEVHFIAHENPKWTYLGILNPELGTEFERTPIQLKDYWVFPSEEAFLVRRRSDGQATRAYSDATTQVVREYRNSQNKRHNLTAWTGNKLSFRTKNSFFELNLDSVTQGASWVPFWVDGSLPETAGETPETETNNMAAWLLAALSALLAVVLIRQRRSSNPASPPLQAFESTAPYSPSVMTLAVHKGSSLTADEFDQLMGLGSITSPETKRSKRARIIQLVNAEVFARLGVNLIERAKSKEDKRVVIYNIGSIYDEDSP